MAVKIFPLLLLSMYVSCVFVCLFVCLVLYRRHRLTLKAKILTEIPICKYLKMVFFTFCLFLYYSPFYYFLYFKATSQTIMKINAPN